MIEVRGRVFFLQSGILGCHGDEIRASFFSLLRFTASIALWLVREVLFLSIIIAWHFRGD